MREFYNNTCSSFSSSAGRRRLLRTKVVSSTTTKCRHHQTKRLLSTSSSSSSRTNNKMRSSSGRTSSSNNHNNNTNSSKLPIILHPYSQSLPNPGYEWCSRCEIRCKQFQKKINDRHNDPCHQLPKRIPFLRSGICQSAKNYYQQQMNYMLLTTLGVFGLWPILFGSSSSSSSSSIDLDD